MQIYAVCNRKGGCGKTATALNLGAGLHRSGRRVLFIDLDAQCDLTTNLAIDPEDIPTIYEVLTREATPEESIVTTTEGDLIPASPLLANIEKTITETGKEYRLAEALKQIRKEYDYIIIDTAPGLSILSVIALTSATKALITTEPRKASIDGIIQLNDSIQAVKRYTNKRLQIEGILITRAKTRTILTRDMKTNLEAIAEHLKTRVFNTIIRDCNAIGEAEAMQESIFEYAPRSNGARDYKALIEEILQKGD